MSQPQTWCHVLCDFAVTSRHSRRCQTSDSSDRGDWIRAEYERATARWEALPEYARPVVMRPITPEASCCAKQDEVIWRLRAEVEVLRQASDGHWMGTGES